MPALHGQPTGVLGQEDGSGGEVVGFGVSDSTGSLSIKYESAPAGTYYLVAPERKVGHRSHRRVCAFDYEQFELPTGP